MYHRLTNHAVTDHTVGEQMQETFSRKEEAEVTEAKARVRLEKARAMLKEAQDLVTVYVVSRRVKVRRGWVGREKTTKTRLADLALTGNVLCVVTAN